MKRFAFFVVWLIATPLAMAHTPLFDCYDNGDDSVTCEGGFSDGSSAAGIDIHVVDSRGKILEQGKLDQSGSLSFKRPAGEFSVVFSPGTEHSLTMLGDDIVE